MSPVHSQGPSSDATSHERTCPLCGGAPILTILHSDTFQYGSGDSAATLHVDIPVRHCAECEIEFIDDDGERIRHDAVCRHLGVLTPTEIRQIRKTHRMTRAAFAQVTGIGVATLNRWENGIVVQSLANDRYLRILSAPGTLAKLKNLIEPSVVPKNGHIRRFVMLDVSDRVRRDQKSFQLRLAS